jgi:hypothetical protein
VHIVGFSSNTSDMHGMNIKITSLIRTFSTGNIEGLLRAIHLARSRAVALLLPIHVLFFSKSAVSLLSKPVGLFFGSAPSVLVCQAVLGHL